MGGDLRRLRRMVEMRGGEAIVEIMDVLIPC